MEKKFHYDDAEIFYRAEGEGFPVFLIHGFGEDGSIWNEQTSFLKGYCKVFVPDLPGSGHSFFKEHTSSKKSQFTPSSIEYYAAAIHELIIHEKINSCIMLGHSMGGYITLAFAEKYPLLLKGFGFVHSTAFADSDDKKQNRLRGIEMMKEYGSFSFLKNTIPNLFAEKYKKEESEKIEYMIELGKNFSTKALEQYYTAMLQRPDRTNVLKNSKVPVLFIAGTEDVAAPLKDVLQQSHLPEIAYFHVLENTGHMGMWEAKDEVNKILLNYINEILASE